MTKARLKVTEEEQRALKWEHEVLEQRFEKVGSKQLLIVLMFIYVLFIYVWRKHI